MLVPFVYAIAEHVALNNMSCLAQQLVLYDDFVGDGRAVLTFHGPPGHKSSLGAQVGGPGPFGEGPGPQESFPNYSALNTALGDDESKFSYVCGFSVPPAADPHRLLIAVGYSRSPPFFKKKKKKKCIN